MYQNESKKIKCFKQNYLNFYHLKINVQLVKSEKYFRSKLSF